MCFVYFNVQLVKINIKPDIYYTNITTILHWLLLQSSYYTFPILFFFAIVTITRINLTKRNITVKFKVDVSVSKN